MSEPLDLEPIKARLQRLHDRRVGTISDLIDVVADADSLVIEVERLRAMIDRLDPGSWR